MTVYIHAYQLGLKITKHKVKSEVRDEEYDYWITIVDYATGDEIKITVPKIQWETFTFKEE